MREHIQDFSLAEKIAFLQIRTQEGATMARDVAPEQPLHGGYPMQVMTVEV
jgi:hypothetical protein